LYSALGRNFRSAGRGGRVEEGKRRRRERRRKEGRGEREFVLCPRKKKKSRRLCGLGSYQRIQTSYSIGGKKVV